MLLDLSAEQLPAIAPLLSIYSTPYFLKQSKEKQNDSEIVLSLVCCAFMVTAQWECFFHSYSFDSQAPLKQCWEPSSFNPWILMDINMCEYLFVHIRSKVNCVNHLFIEKHCVMRKCSYLRSSVGLAKAALEAINGFNLFGNQVFTFTCLFSSNFLISEECIDCRL